MNLCEGINDWVWMREDMGSGQRKRQESLNSHGENCVGIALKGAA